MASAEMDKLFNDMFKDVDNEINQFRDKINAALKKNADSLNQAAMQAIQQTMQQAGMAGQPGMQTAPGQPSRPQSLPWLKHGLRGFLRKIWHGNHPDNPSWQGYTGEHVLTLEENNFLMNQLNEAADIIISEVVPADVIGASLSGQIGDIEKITIDFRNNLKTIIRTALTQADIKGRRGSATTTPSPSPTSTPAAAVSAGDIDSAAEEDDDVGQFEPATDVVPGEGGGDDADVSVSTTNKDVVQQIDSSENQEIDAKIDEMGEELSKFVNKKTGTIKYKSRGMARAALKSLGLENNDENVQRVFERYGYIKPDGQEEDGIPARTGGRTKHVPKKRRSAATTTTTTAATPPKKKKKKKRSPVIQRSSELHSVEGDAPSMARDGGDDDFDSEDWLGADESRAYEDFVARNIIEGLPPKYRLNFFRETLSKGARGSHVLRHKVRNMPIEERTKYFKELLNS